MASVLMKVEATREAQKYARVNGMAILAGPFQIVHTRTLRRRFFGFNEWKLGGFMRLYMKIGKKNDTSSFFISIHAFSFELH